MRPIVILLLCLSTALLWSAPAALEIVRPVIATSDGGPPEPASFEHVPGETLFFTCRVSGFSKTAEEKVHVAYSVQSFDPKGVPLTEIYNNEMQTDVSPQDKAWMPKISTEIQLPPLLASGTYKLVVTAEDLFAKTSAKLDVPFQVRGRTVEPSDTLVVRNFQFFRNEDDTQPLEVAAYKPGDAVWARFDITGFKHGEKNHIDVSYVTTVHSPSGKLLWTQPEPAVDQSDSFYPKRYVQASMGITLLKDTKPGEFAIGVTIKDGVSGQTYETRQKFTVE
jgi:hypothetical protein